MDQNRTQQIESTRLWKPLHFLKAISTTIEIEQGLWLKKISWKHMKFKICLLLSLSPLLFSCGGEELIPRTHPQFSMTMIQDISSGGAEFRAAMKDYGSDEIIEYGFTYSDSRNPNVKNSDFVSEKGVPGSEFSLKTNYGLIKGRIYYVSAFIKTTRGIIYSQPTEFLSQGSEGFIFEKLEIKQPLYYGDTITVFGSNLSIVTSEYKASINQTIATVVDVTKESFKIVTPRFYPTDRVDDQSVRLEIKLSVSGKELQINQEVKFVEPVFSIKPNQEVVLQATGIIEGQYLATDFISLEVINPLGGRKPLSITEQSDKEIRFVVDLNNSNYTSDILLRIRGKEYVLPSFLKMRKSEWNPDQKLRGKSWDYFEVKGENFIPIRDANLFISEPVGEEIRSQAASNTLVGLQFNRGTVPRFLKVYANNFGVKSDNFAEFEFTDSNLRWLLLPNIFNRAQSLVESAVTVDGVGYFFTERDIYKISPESKKHELVAKAPDNVSLLAGNFSYSAGNGIVYLGARGGSPLTNSFWEFNTKTNSLRQLADIPSQANKPKLVYSTNSHFYYEGGYTFGPDGYSWDEGVYKYSIQSNTWTKTNRTFENNFYTLLYRTFKYKGEIYAVINGLQNSNLILQRFDESSEKWEFVRDLATFRSAATSNEYFVLGDWIYFTIDQTISAFNMATKESKSWSGSSPGFNFPYSFFTSSKFYSLSRGYLYEFDPSYFD